jgi:hypothetical protein
VVSARGSQPASAEQRLQVIGVASLPLGTPIELEFIVEVAE